MGSRPWGRILAYVLATAIAAGAIASLALTPSSLRDIHPWPLVGLLGLTMLVGAWSAWRLLLASDNGRR